MCGIETQCLVAEYDDVGRFNGFSCDKVGTHVFRCAELLEVVKGEYPTQSIGFESILKP